MPPGIWAQSLVNKRVVPKASATAIIYVFYNLYSIKETIYRKQMNM